jgi:hypothetical protein
MATMMNTYGLPSFKLSNGTARLPKLPHNESYFSNNNKIELAEIKRSKPKNEAEAEVKRLLSNEMVFELLSNADNKGEYKKGTAEGITRKDLRKAAAKAGDKHTLEYKDVVALFIDRLKDDVENGDDTVDDDDSTTSKYNDDDDESTTSKDDDKTSTCGDKKHHTDKMDKTADDKDSKKNDKKKQEYELGGMKISLSV